MESGVVRGKNAEDVTEETAAAGRVYEYLDATGWLQQSAAGCQVFWMNLRRLADFAHAWLAFGPPARE